VNDPRLKPKPLPPDPRFLNRLEYGLQWLVWKLVVPPGHHPVLNGLATSLRMLTVILIVFGSVAWGIWFCGNAFVAMSPHFPAGTREG
jgi:hypothetical protein